MTYPHIRPTEDPEDRVGEILTHLAPPLRDEGTQVARIDARWCLEEAGFFETIAPATRRGPAVDNMDRARRNLTTRQFIAAGLV